MNLYIPNDKFHQPIRSKRVLHELRSSYSTWEPIWLKWDNGILVRDDSPNDECDGTVTIPGEIGLETVKGIQFYDGHKTVWLPKSQIKWNGADHLMTMPLWLSQKHGFL